MKFDLLCVGAGVTSAVIAERCANELGASVLVVEKRNHVAGNCHDTRSRNGVLVSSYGPHYFRTNSDKVIKYLSRFTEFRPARYQVMAQAKGDLWDFPVNLRTFEQYIGRASTPEEMQQWVADDREKYAAAPANAEEALHATVGQVFTDLFFRNYSERHWGCDLDEIDASVVRRIPFRFTRDNRYFNERFQQTPVNGFTPAIERMLKHEKIRVLLQCDYKEILAETKRRHTVMTGPVDEWFNYSEGRLPYRSLRFEVEDLDYASHQPCLQVNNCDKGGWNRTVDYNYLSAIPFQRTTITREYPQAHAPGNDPFYPLPTREAKEQFSAYENRCAEENDVTFAGRLATYRYLNIDETVALALQAWEKQVKPALTAKGKT